MFDGEVKKRGRWEGVREGGWERHKMKLFTCRGDDALTSCPV